MNNQNKETNSFYLNEDRRREPKEYFKMIYREIQNVKCSTLCDIGCATGDFLWYVNEMFNKNEVRLTGIDNFDELRDVAKQRLPQCDFIKGDIYTLEGIDTQKKYDIVTMSGVLYLFDDFQTPIKNIMNITNKGGVAYIFSTYNEKGYTVETRFSKDGETGRIMTFSKQEIGKYLEQLGYEYEFIPFYIETTIEKNEEDALRSYTLPLANGRNGVVNGIDVYHRFYLLKIMA